jgi:tetratricopeptide (TPR) repeat protein
MSGMPDATETRTTKDQSFLVGKVRPPVGAWTAIEGIVHADPIRNGVLIIFGEKVRGRVGIFCNRYISGAINETTGTTGIEAARDLLSVTTGMFGYRAVMGSEGQELAQGLAFDLEEMLLLRDENPEISKAVLKVAVSGHGQRVRDTQAMEPALDNAKAAASAPAPQVQVEKSTPDENFSYIDWFDEKPDTEELPKFRQILMNVTPQKADPEKAAEVQAEAQNDLALYGKLLEAEKQKVIRDIELSMKRASEGTGTNEKESIDDLKMMSAFIQAEQSRTQKWQGLDEIPTPRSLGGGRTKPGNIPRSANEFSQKDRDLLSVSKHKITLPKDFIKRVALEEPPPKPTLLNTEWMRHPAFIAGSAVLIIGCIGYGIVSWQARNEFEDYLSHARSALKAKHAPDAIFVLDQAIAKDGSNHRAFFYRGLAYSDVGNFENAAADFETSMKLGGPRERTLIARASAATRLGKYQEAITDCTDILKVNPKSVEAMMIRATCWERIKDYGKVVTDTTNALAITKDRQDTAHLLLQRGVAYGKEGKQALASKDFGEAIRLKPDAATYMQRGDAYRTLKNYIEAADDYSKVIAFDPRNYQAYVVRGMCYASLHKDKEALKDFGRALALNKTCVEALIQRGSLHLSNQHYRLAANDLEDAMALAPTDIETQQKLAATYQHLHKSFPISWLHNNQVVASQNTSSTPTRTSSDGTDTAGGGFKMPSDPAELVHVGYKYLTQGQVEYATQMFAAAIKKQPNNVDARRYMAHALLQSGSPSGAVQQFDALVDLEALTSKDAMAFVKALTATGANSRAVDILTQCVSSRPRDTAMRGELMRLYGTLGQTARAQAVYQDGLRYARTPAQRAELESAFRNSGSSSTTSPGGSKATASDLGG